MFAHASHVTQLAAQSGAQLASTAGGSVNVLNEAKNDKSLSNSSQDDIQNYIWTILAITILEKKYQKDASEWKLIKQKAVKWCKSMKDSIIDDKYSNIEDKIKNLI